MNTQRPALLDLTHIAFHCSLQFKFIRPLGHYHHWSVFDYRFVSRVCMHSSLSIYMCRAPITAHVFTLARPCQCLCQCLYLSVLGVTCRACARQLASTRAPTGLTLQYSDEHEAIRTRTDRIIVPQCLSLHYSMIFMLTNWSDRSAFCCCCVSAVTN